MSAAYLMVAFIAGVLVGVIAERLDSRDASQDDKHR